MSASKNIRLDLSADLHAKMVERCARQGITQKEYLNGLLERDLVESVRREHEADQARNRREATKVEAPVKSLSAVADDVSKIVTTLEKTLPERLAGVGKTLGENYDKAIAALDFRGHLAAQKTAADTRSVDLKAHFDAGLSKVEKGAVERHSELLGRLDAQVKSATLTKARKRRLVLITTALVTGSPAAFAFLFPASAPIRWTVVRAMGERTERDAATVLAGSGVRYNGALMAETAALLNDPFFARDYGSCIERAKRTTSVSAPCRFRITALGKKP